MGLMTGKKGIVMGVANERSLAWGIAKKLAEKYNIEAVPTIVIFKKGKELGRTSGYMEMEEFEKFLIDTVNAGV